MMGGTRQPQAPQTGGPDPRVNMGRPPVGPIGGGDPYSMGQPGQPPSGPIGGGDPSMMGQPPMGPIGGGDPSLGNRNGVMPAYGQRPNDYGNPNAGLQGALSGIQGQMAPPGGMAPLGSISGGGGMGPSSPFTQQPGGPMAPSYSGGMAGALQNQMQNSGMAPPGSLAGAAPAPSGSPLSPRQAYPALLRGIRP